MLAALFLLIGLFFLLWHNRRIRAEIRRRQATEEELAAQRDLLAAVFDATEDAILVLDANFHVLAVNSTGARRFGQTVEAMLGQDLLGLTDPETAKTRRQHYEQALESNRPLSFQDTRRGHAYANVLHPLPAGPGGQKRLAIYARDVTAPLAAEAALRNSEERLTKIFHLTPAVIIILSQPENRLLDANETFIHTAGRPRHELLGRTPEELGLWLDPEDRDRIFKGIQQTGLVRNLEIRFRLQAPAVTGTGLLSCTTLEANGQPCLLAVMMDITKRKEMERALRRAKEEAEAASLAKTRFLSIMSHEVRTPMNTVLGMVDVLRDSGLSDEQQTYLRALEQAGESLMELLEAVLEVSRIESGTIRLRQEAYNPGEVARLAAAPFLARAAAKHLHLTVTIAPEVEATTAWGDAACIRQVLDKLLNNALKFTDAGSVQLELTRLAGAQGREELCFSVSDTGSGIPSEMQQAVFKPFTLLDDSTTRMHGGAGLGLALGAMLAQAMGGRIILQSEPQHGSVFHLQLPRDGRDSNRSVDNTPQSD